MSVYCRSLYFFSFFFCFHENNYHSFQHGWELINNRKTAAWTCFVCLCTGKQHLIKIKCCEHEPEAITLVRNGFWPSTPKQPQVAFDLGFMVLLQYIFLECRVSLKSICQVLHWLVPPASQGLRKYSFRSVLSYAQEYNFFS